MKIRATVLILVISTIAFAAISSPAMAGKVRAYVGCGWTAKTKPSKTCPAGGRIGAFFRSPRAGTFTVCIRFADTKRICVDQPVEAGVLYLNKVENSGAGKAIVTWSIRGRKVASATVAIGSS